MSTVCNYCQHGYQNDYLINSATKMSKKRDFYPGVEVVIDDGTLWVTASPDTYEPGYMEEFVKINFCPMCGRKLEE